MCFSVSDTTVAEFLMDTVNTVPPCVLSNAKQMPASVCDALMEAFQTEGGLSASEAQEMLDAMEKSSRFQSETWA